MAGIKKTDTKWNSSTICGPVSQFVERCLKNMEQFQHLSIYSLIYETKLFMYCKIIGLMLGACHQVFESYDLKGIKLQIFIIFGERNWDQ